VKRTIKNRWRQHDTKSYSQRGKGKEVTTGLETTEKIKSKLVVVSLFLLVNFSKS
jgi:hypothetical protein